MGKVRVRRETGTLFLDFRFRGHRCREQTNLLDSPANRRALERLLAKVERDATIGELRYREYFPDSPLADRFDPKPAGAPETASQPTIGQYTTAWLRQMEGAWTPAHTRRVKGTLNGLIVPAFGTKRPGEVTRAAALEFRAELLKRPGRSPGTTLSRQRVNHVMFALGQLLAAMAEEFGTPNHCLGLKHLKLSKLDVHPFSPDEVRMILESVRPDFRPYYTVRFFTGLRSGEIDGLRWRHVDFERQLILVRESIVDGKPSGTKTYHSARDVQISRLVVEALRVQQATIGKQAFVFASPTGKPYSQSWVTRGVWYPLLKRLGLEPRTPYQTRHTAATLWLGAGENPEWVARQLGHTSTEMLFRRYSHFIPNLTRRDGSAAEAFIERAMRGTQPPTTDNQGADE